MLELLDLTQTLQKSEYAAAMPALRAELRDLQQAILAAGIPVVVLLEGWDAAGKGARSALNPDHEPSGVSMRDANARNAQEHILECPAAKL